MDAESDLEYESNLLKITQQFHGRAWARIQFQIIYGGVVGSEWEGTKGEGSRGGW